MGFTNIQPANFAGKKVETGEYSGRIYVRGPFDPGWWILLKLLPNGRYVAQLRNGRMLEGILTHEGEHVGRPW